MQGTAVMGSFTCTRQMGHSKQFKTAVLVLLVVVLSGF
jgi:hypothetical protein